MDKQMLGVMLRTEGGVSGFSTAADPSGWAVDCEAVPASPCPCGASLSEKVDDPRLNRQEYDMMTGW